MIVKSKSLYSFFAFNFIVCLFLNLSCGGGGKSSGSEQQKDFNKEKLTTALRESILTIPQNIQLMGEASSGKKNKSLAYDGLWANNYAAITDSINYSELVKSNVISFLDFVFETKDLANAELNTFIETGEGEVWAYKLEDISGVEGEKFKWKISLYFRFSYTADVICRFTLVNGKMKGQILENGYVTLPITIDDETTTLTTYLTYDIRFDGTSLPQTLDINYTKDLSEILNFVELYWPDLTTEQFDEINLGQIGKSSVKIIYDGLEYGISGANYSPGANFESILNLEIKLYGEDHSTYAFRAKSIKGTVDGAKMEVALPKDTLEDVSNIWEDDSISNLFQKNILNFMNSYLNQMIDENDDTRLLDSIYLGSVLLESADFSISVQEEQRLGFETLYLFLGDKIGIPSLIDHGFVVTAEEFAVAESFWGSNSFTSYNTNSVAEINDILSSTDVLVTDEIKNEVYYRVMAASIIEYYQTNPVELTITDIENFLIKKNDFFSLGLKNLINAKKYIFNPAFFEKKIGFLGTYDGSNFYSYQLSSDSLAIGVKPENFDVLNNLDLSTLSVVKPLDVYHLSIDVK